MHKKIYTLSLLLYLAIYGNNHVEANSLDNLLIKQQQIVQQHQQDISSKQTEEILQNRINKPIVHLSSKKGNLEIINLPSEKNSFKINNFSLEKSSFSQKFNWINKYLANFNGKYIGTQGINLLMKQINTEIMNRGYVTTRIYIKEQNLSTGKLYFSLMPGIISNIHFKENTWGTYTNAIAMQTGSLLNIRDIEQTIDNFNSVPGQTADIKIEPGKNEGESDLVIDIQRNNPISLSFTIDNSGTDTTGKVQMSGMIQISQLFSSNDIFYASWNEDATQSGEKKGTRASSLYYSIPFGKDRFSYLHTQNDYRQTVEYAVNPFISSGKFTHDILTISHLLERNQSSKTDLELGLIHKTRHSYIDGTEISVQKQKTTAMSLGVNRRQYLGASVLDTSFKWQKGLPWWSDAGPTDEIPNEATTQYNLYLYSLNFTTPVHITKNYNAQYNMSLRGQKTNDLIYGSEFFSIGDMYSVRGFDGEQTLSAESGFVIRNELRFPFAKSHQFYLGLDYGKVSGPSTEYLLGTELIGSAIGFRGNFGQCSYDVFIGYPLKKPDGFICNARTYGFMFNTYF